MTRLRIGRDGQLAQRAELEGRGIVGKLACALMLNVDDRIVLELTHEELCELLELVRPGPLEARS